MGILKTINEAMSVKQLASMFNTGYIQTQPGHTRIDKIPFSASMSSKYNANISQSIVSSDPKTSILANMLASIYTQTYTTKKELFELIKSVKDLDQASVIINDFIDDCFSTPDSDYPFTIEISDDVDDKEYVEDILAKFIKKFDIYQLDKDTVEDFLVYGDYYFNTVPKIGEGIVEINDNVDCENVFSIYRNSELIQHIGMGKNQMFAGSALAGWAGQLKAIHPDLLSHFYLDSRKIKLELPTELSGILSLPESIRIGRSVLFDALALLKKYQLLDMALTYKEVRNALMPVFLGVQTGAFTKPDEIIEACKTIESYLQEGTAMEFDIENSSSMQELLGGASSVKIAPIPGDKGRLEKIDIGQGSSDTSGLNDILGDTGHRVAVAAGGVTSDEAGKSRLEILKCNSRRSKRLIDIQRGRSNGWRDMMHKHLRYKHINVEKESIKVMYKSIPNADIFEEANGLVTLLSVMNDLQTYADTVNQADNGVHINPDKLIDAFNLFIGNRYPVVKDFIELDAVKEQFPNAADMINNADKTQVATGPLSKQDGDQPQINTGVNNTTALNKMNQSFAGSSGSSDAVGR